MVDSKRSSASPSHKAAWVVRTAVLALMFPLLALPRAEAQLSAPTADPNEIASQFGTVYAAGEGVPTTGGGISQGEVVVEGSPAEVTVSLDPSEGATIIDQDGNAFTVAPVVASSDEVGLAGDYVVAYDTNPADAIEVDLAVRPTSDGGAEWTQYVPPGKQQVQWTITSEGPGTVLVGLENGTVAVVDPDSTPDPAMADAAEALTASRESFIDAAVENATAAAVSEELAAAAVAATQVVPLSEDPVASQEVGEVPAESEYADEGGEVPPFLQETPDPAALEEEVESLLAEVSGTPLSPEDQELLDFAADAAAAAESAHEATLRATDAELDAAMTDESNEMLAEDIDQILIEETQKSMSAELDIADADAETQRAAVALVEAQAEVGRDGQVLGVFAAPMSKTLDGIPVSTTVEILDANTVAVNIPDIGEAVVVDPFFIPIAIFVVRTVAQFAVQQAVRAAAQYAARQAAIRLAQQAAQQAARVAARRVAEAARQQAARAAARAYSEQQRIAALRTQAQVATRIAAERARQQAAANAQRLAAQAAKAKELAVKAATTARDKAVQAKQELLRRQQALQQQKDQLVREVGARARAVTEQVTNTAAKAVQVGSKTVSQAVQATREAVTKTIQLAKNPQAKALAEKWGMPAIKEAVVQESLDRLISTAVEQKMGDCFGLLANGAHTSGVPTTAASLVAAGYTAKGVVGCANKLEDESKPDEPVIPEDANGRLPGATELGATALDAYDVAQAAAQARALVFSVAPGGTPAGVSVTEVVVPNPVSADAVTHLMIVLQNNGPAMSLGDTFVQTTTPLPWLTSGASESDKTKLRLVDENGDGVWSFMESVAALVEINVPVVGSQALQIPFHTISNGVNVPGGTGTVTLNVVGPNPPAAPTLTASSGSSGQVPLSWTVPSSSPKAPVTGYEVQLNSSSVRTTSATSLTWTGLSNGSSYSFRVRACSIVGCGAWSAVKSVTPYTVPSTVATPSISSLNNALKISYSAPASGGSAITRYEVSGGVSVSTTSTSYTHSTGQSGTARNYRVRACNAAGCGGWSAYSATIRPKVISLVRGGAAPYGYWYDTTVYGPAGWSISISCEGPSAGAWWSQTARLDASGFYRDSTHCYSGYSGGHWVTSGSLRSNTVSW